MKQKRSFNIIILAMFSLVLTVLASYSVTHAQDWYDANWLHRKAITIDADQVDATLTNFPVLIDTIDTDLAAGARSDGFDILFTDDTGTAKLDHEIESYADSTGDLVAWVKVPSLSSSTNTTVYMYYGYSAASNQENPTGVWDTNFVMVQHLDETSETHLDSTGNANDGTAYNLATQDAPGKIAGADEFDRSGDLIDVGTDASLDVFGPNQDFSIFLWAKRDTTTLVEGFFSSGSSGPNGIYFGSASSNTDDLKFMSLNNTVSIDSTTGVIGDTGWHHVGVTADRDGNLTFWVDGDSVHSQSIAGTAAQNWNRADDTYKIGTDRSEANPMDGIIDEVRVSDMVRSADWITASYRNQNNPGSFYSIGAESECALDTDCDDSIGCTDDTCVTGTCVYTTNNGLCSDANLCTDDICTVGVGCSNPNNTDPCDDSIACTQTDVCSGGTCNGTPNNTLCSDGNGCTDDICTVGVGCSNPNNTDPCDDSIACTQTDVCSGGTCNGTPNNTLCSDANGCTDDICTVGVGCSNPNNTDPCDDSIACTQTDVCSGGTCNGTPNNTLCSDANGCTDDICTVGVGCSNPNNTNPCDDSIACTQTDVCSGGTCNGTPNNTLCSDANGCTDDICTVGVGCSNPNNTDPCDDSIACTQTDVCSGGTCNGTPNNTLCSDANGCTDDICTVGVGCSNPNNTDPCDDTVFCNGADTCSGGTCSEHAGDPCSPQLCDEGTGTCVNCLVNGDCDDSTVCTDDSCINGFCSWSNNFAPCDDGDACTEVDGCYAGICEGGTPLDCNDSNMCTDDSCDSGTGCVNTDNTASCDDGDACTEGDACASGTCIGGAALDCDDSNVCTDDSCDTVAGCVNTPAGDGGTCDDRLFCTDFDQCLAGECTGSGDPCAPYVCDEVNDVCMKDWWDTAWRFRKAITIDPDRVADDLTDFPVLIDLTDADLATYAQDNGDDLAFTDDNAIQLDHEIEFYDNGTGTLIAWVRVPDLSSTEETVLYLYFGNSDAGNQENVPGTWDSNYVMVQHLDEPSETHFDSTGNGNDGTAYDLATQDAPGKIDGADEFDASGDVIDVGTAASLDVFGPNQDFSIFLWAKRDAITEVEGFFSSGSSGLNGIFFGSASGNEDDLKFMSSLNNTVSIESTAGAIGDTGWHHVGVTADRDGILQFWVDGFSVYSEDIATTSTEDWNRADDTYKIGTDRSETNPMDGIIDEVRVSDMVRGAGWIQTSYTNQNDPGAFYLLGGLEILADADDDGIPDDLDNCPGFPNGPLQGTCTEAAGTNMLVSTGQYCTVDVDCDPGEFCEKTQADTYPPGGDGIGDACDCEADFDCDAGGSDVDAINVGQFLFDFGRSVYFNPCSDVRPCYGDFNCDSNVDADDVPKLLEDFGRTIYINPCPACVRIPADWCVYP